MICPYCNKEVSGSTQYCPQCGQSISAEVDSTTSNAYWDNVRSNDANRSQQYKTVINEHNKIESTRKKQNIKIVIVLVILAVTGVAGILGYQKYQANALAQVKSDLVGTTMKCSYSNMEAGFWIHYYYYTLEFKDQEMLDYYYLTTIGPAENDEKPKYQDTYTYTVTRSIFGKYVISVNGQKFILNLSDEGIPKSISLS